MSGSKTNTSRAVWVRLSSLTPFGWARNVTLESLNYK